MAALFAATLLTYVYANEPKWECEIRLGKQRYIVHEPIWLDVTLTNLASDTVRTHGLEAPNHLGVYILLTDSTGDTIKYTGPQWLFATSPGRLLLAPGEQISGSFDLTDFFFSNDDVSGYAVHHWYFSHIPKGEYAVRVYFEGAASITRSFDIVEPEGDEREALRLIEDATKLAYEGNKEQSAQIFKKVTERFPGSVFASKCYYLYREYDHWDEIKEGTWDKKAFYRDMIEKYPNSGNSRDWLRAITSDLDSAGSIEYYNRVLEAHPNTRASNFAQEMRREIFGSHHE